MELSCFFSIYDFTEYDIQPALKSNPQLSKRQASLLNKSIIFFNIFKTIGMHTWGLIFYKDHRA